MTQKHGDISELEVIERIIAKMKRSNSFNAEFKKFGGDLWDLTFKEEM